MALFGKASAGALLKKLQTEPNLGSKEIQEILDTIRFSSEFSLESNPWLFRHPQKKVREFAVQEAKTKATPKLIEGLVQVLIETTGEVRRDIAAGMEDPA